MRKLSDFGPGHFGGSLTPLGESLTLQMQKLGKAPKAAPGDKGPSDRALVVAYRRAFPLTLYTDSQILERGAPLMLMPARTFLALAASLIEEHEPGSLAEPEPPVDPDVLAVREILAAIVATGGLSLVTTGYQNGEYDLDPKFQAALAAYRTAKSRFTPPSRDD